VPDGQALPQLGIWGAAGHAKVVADIVRCEGRCAVVGFLDNINPDRKNAEFCGAKILGGMEALRYLYEEGVRGLIIAFGDCEARLKLARLAKEHGFILATAIHPRAVIANSTEVGEGTVVAAGAVINPGAVVGANVIINTAATVDHDCLLEDGVHIGPGAHIGGHCRVGRAAWIGIGATVIDGISVGAGTIIGAGAVVVRNIPENVIAYGVPARVMRKRIDDK
jgi:acetyltransferase EpsM